MEEILKMEKQNREEHERLLHENFLNFQLGFVRKILDGSTPFPGNIGVDKTSIESCLNNMTDIRRDIYRIYCDHIGIAGINNEDEHFQSIKNKIFEKIYLEFTENKNFSASGVSNIINEYIKQLPIPEVIEGQKEKPKQEKNEAGLIDYNLKPIVNSEFNVPKYVLEENNIDIHDYCVTLNMPALYQQKYNDENKKNIFSSGSLKLLAQDLVKNYPETRIVLGKSWLMNTVIGKRAGFHVYQEGSRAFGEGFWGQFVDENGNLDKKRCDELYKNGIPPFRVSEGYMTIEEFLKKYLPEEQKNIAKLKKANTEFAENFIKDKLTQISYIRNNWNHMTVDDLKQKIEETKVYSLYFKTPEGIDVLSRILELKAQNKDITVLEEEMAGFSKSIDDFFQKNKYLEYAPELL
jgi:hypothetical protein